MVLRFNMYYVACVAMYLMLDFLSRCKDQRKLATRAQRRASMRITHASRGDMVVPQSLRKQGGESNPPVSSTSALA